LAVPLAAQPERGDSVLVLEAATGGWKEGVQALVAELITTGHELSVRAVDAPSPEQLQQALKSAVAQSGVAAGVSVTREADSATALLCRRGASSCEKVVMDIADGELSRSRLALAVVERLRPIDLPATQPPPPRCPRQLPRIRKTQVPCGPTSVASEHGWAAAFWRLAPPRRCRG
jgi:hypothetical protein